MYHFWYNTLAPGLVVGSAGFATYVPNAWCCTNRARPFCTHCFCIYTYLANRQLGNWYYFKQDARRACPMLLLRLSQHEHE